MGEWISVFDNLPAYGEPVLIVVGETVQHVIYMRDGADDAPDWFEPYHFEHDDNQKIFWGSVTHWMPLPEPPHNP